jgi:hypothetical protein
VASCHHSALPCKAIHLKIKDSVASDLLMSDWGLLVSFLDVENATLTFFISLAMASAQRVLMLFSLSMA